ncbi:MAG TPA: hypothetical protein VHF90_10085 [Thermoleophilaceae bacterium]|nr:hypothetical protein [Thermoleophilaceae bacterium]
MSAARGVGFGEAPVEQEAHGIASRAIEVEGVRWAVVEYDPGARREEWCEEGHCGMVIEGEVVYELADGGALHVAAGEGFALPDGDGHRARAGAAGARLFVIDRAP